MAVVAYLINVLCYALLTLLLIRVIFSYFSKNDEHPIYLVTYKVTEPLLGPVRKLIPSGLTAGLDLSPVIVGIALFVIIGVANLLG
jgi:YggT family protein